MNDATIYEEFANNYGISLENVYYYADMIRMFDFAGDGEHDLFIDCLDTLLQGICSRNDLVEYHRTEKYTPIKYDSIIYLLSDALYRTYGDIALPYLDEEYLDLNSSRI